MKLSRRCLLNIDLKILVFWKKEKIINGNLLKKKKMLVPDILLPYFW